MKASKNTPRLSPGLAGKEFRVVGTSIDSGKDFRFYVLSFVDDPQEGCFNVIAFMETLNAPCIVGGESYQPPTVGVISR